MDDGLVVSKASLVTLSHAFEEACLHEADADRLVVACFQKGVHFGREHERYAAMSELAAEVVVLHADDPLSVPGVHEVRIPRGHPLLNAWDIVITSPRSGAALICEDLGLQHQTEDVPERDRAFAARWSFLRPDAVAEARQVLDQVTLPEPLAARVEGLLTTAAERPVSHEERHMAVAFDHLVFSLESAHLRARAAAGEADRNRALAQRDELTGTFNRTFVAQMQHRRRDDGPMAAVLLDLNDFKAVNDTHGHEAGDRVLRSIGHELRSTVRAGDLVVRWGGDEFLVLLPQTTVADARTQAERLVSRLEAIDFDGPLAGYTVRTSAGVGLLDADELDLSAIDSAMYDAKASGGGVATVG